MANVIVTRGNSLAIQGEDAVVTAAVKPGMLLVRATGGVKPHATDGGGGTLMIATEKNAGLIGGDKSSAYAIGDQCSHVVLPSGAQFYAYLASGENVAALAELTSNGDGYFKEDTGSDTVVVRTLEAVNASAAAALVLVEVI
jgi:hypothetical protein